MAWTGTDDFESYALGDLTGNNGGSGWNGAWSGDVLYDVVSTPVQEGVRGVEVVAAATEPEMERPVTLTTSGIVQYYHRRDTTSIDNQETVLADGSAGLGRGVDFNSNGNIQGTRLTDNSAFQTYAANTWYQMKIEYDTGTDQLRVSINGGAFSAWRNFSVASAGITHFRMLNGSVGGTSKNYWDAISVGAAAAVATIPTLLFMGVG